MSLCTVIDGKLGPDLATNDGWFRFIQWVESLSDAPALKELVDGAWTELPITVERELQRAMLLSRPDQDTLDVGQRLAELLKTCHDTLTVTDGLYEGEDEG